MEVEGGCGKPRGSARRGNRREEEEGLDKEWKALETGGREDGTCG